MCLIIAKPVSQVIPTALLEDAFVRNSDGWGIMFVDNGAVQAIKGFSLDELIRHVHLVQGGREIFVHLRMRTDGAINMQNCHPFEIGKSGIWMMHNGIIDVETDGQKSDTAVFVEMITPILEASPALVFETGFTSLVHEYIGSSRVVFLHPNGQYNVVTDTQWVEWEGLLLSNRYAWSLHRKGKDVIKLPDIKEKIYFPPVGDDLPVTTAKQDVDQDAAYAAWWDSRTVTPERISMANQAEVNAWMSELSKPHSDYALAKTRLERMDMDYGLDELITLSYAQLRELGKTPEIFVNAIYEAGRVTA